MKTRPRASLSVALAGLAVLLLVAPPIDAIQVPQTREEFVRAVAGGARGVKMESFVIERGFDEVYGTLEARTTPCLDVVVKRAGMVGNQMEVSSSDYNPTLRRVDRDRAEFSLQVIHRPRGVGAVPPPGGLYIMAADLKRAGAGRTEVVLYRPSIGFKDISKGFMQWVDGRSGDCPKLK